MTIEIQMQGLPLHLWKGNEGEVTISPTYHAQPNTPSNPLQQQQPILKAASTADAGSLSLIAFELLQLKQLLMQWEELIH